VSEVRAPLDRSGGASRGSRSAWLTFVAMHWLVTLIGIALVSSTAQTAAANGVQGLTFALKLLFGVVIAFCLPLVYPLLTFEALRWWTGGGFVALALVAALNSALVVSLVRLIVRAAGSLRRRR
jgi:hypothetical protein